jgi:hypothetical protein
VAGAPLWNVPQVHPVRRVPKRVPSGGGASGEAAARFAIGKAAQRYRLALPQYPRERETTPVKGRLARNAATFCMAIGAADSGSVEAAT